jgi:hypothetical protein
VSAGVWKCFEINHDWEDQGYVLLADGATDFEKRLTGKSKERFKVNMLHP